MIQEEYSTVSLHNVAGTEPAGWDPDGLCLHRVPLSVAKRLNVVARERMRHPAGCELRFVPEGDETIEVVLSAESAIGVRPFWGTFQGETVHELGPTPTTIELAIPPRIASLSPDSTVSGAFDPRVCRLRFEPWSPVALHDVSGRCRPPTDEELPDCRYLAYGTSITEGASASATHLSYVSRVARRLGVDGLNLGSSGSAFCERAIADHIANRSDWDMATLALSVNMADKGFTIEQFRERTSTLVDIVADTHPHCPIVCVTLFPYYADIHPDHDSTRASEFRSILGDIAGRTTHDNVHLVSGTHLLDGQGLTTDFLHPGDSGMASIGEGIADVLTGVCE